MNSNQGTRGNTNISDLLRNSPAFLSSTGRYSIIVISKNKTIHETLFDTLQHFSLNGRGINIFHAPTLGEAKKIADVNPEIVLVVVDENIIVNGSYKVFVDYLRYDLNIKQCFVTLKENIMRADFQVPLAEDQKINDTLSEFLYARNRLIEITRMIMLTHDMENKISDNGITGNAEHRTSVPETGKKQDKPKITSDKIYNTIAHDLKEPVASIKVILDFLTNEPELLDKNASKELLVRMRESANNVHEMLEDFLFWTRMFKQNIYFNPTRVDIGQTIKSNLFLMKSTALAKGISVQSDIPENLFACADEYMVTTVFRNVIYNTIKYAESDGDISLKAFKASDEVAISVNSSGSGMSTELLKKLFEAEDIDSLKSIVRDTGTGLGFIFCREFINKNGGRIEISETHEKGTGINIFLPAWK